MNGFCLTLGLTLAVSVSAFGHSSQSPQRGSDRGNQAQPQDRPRPSMMDEATKAKVEACAAEVGMPARDSGTKPSREIHDKFVECLSKQGVALPLPHRHRARLQGQGQNRGQNNDQSGEGPPPPPPDPNQ